MSTYLMARDDLLDHLSLLNHHSITSSCKIPRLLSSFAYLLLLLLGVSGYNFSNLLLVAPYESV